MRPCYAYRDGRTKQAIEAVHAKVPFETLYERTGIQFQPFNTVYQLTDDRMQGRLEGVTGFLMIPEYLSYKLTGVGAHEYTNATTTGLVNAKTGEYDKELIRTLGLPETLFGAIVQPGYELGGLLPEIQAEVGGNTKVILCASHDTASAVEGIPMQEGAYLSSGTWSLLGIRSKKPICTPCRLQGKLYERGRRRIYPLPQKHHGHVGHQPLKGELPRKDLRRSHVRGQGEQL